MAARKNKGTKTSGWPVEVRNRIKTSMLVNRLSDHVVGKVELSATQVRAVEILLRKTLPDLSQTEASVTIDRQPDDMSDAELANIAAGRGEASAEEAEGAEESDRFH